jgi:hypothetical protein
MCFGWGGGGDEDVQGRQRGGGVVKYVVHFSSGLAGMVASINDERLHSQEGWKCRMLV